MPDLGLWWIPVIIGAVLIIIFGPLLSIWGLNTLFALSIPYTIKTWFAMIVVAALAKNPPVQKS